MSMMNRWRNALPCALVCLAASLAWADQIVMKNGDRVTGSIVKKDGKNLIVKTDQFGVVTTAWDQVESITADKPVNVVLPDGKTVQGTLSTANGKVEVATKDARLSLAPAEVATIRNDAEQKDYERLLHPGWDQLWNGNASIGLAGTSGNAKTLTYTTGLTASRLSRTDKTTVYFNAIKASALANGKTSETAKAVRGGVAYDHNVSPRFFVNLFNDYEYDRFQNLDLRFVIGGGFGWHAVVSEHSKFDLLGGGDFNRSSFTTPLVQKSGEFYWGDEYNLKILPTTSLVQSFRMFNNLTTTGSYRVNFDIGASTRLTKRLSWNLSVSDRYLNRPAEGRKSNDLLYTTGLGITFAR